MKIIAYDKVRKLRIPIDPYSGFDLSVPPRLNVLPNNELSYYLRIKGYGISGYLINPVGFIMITAKGKGYSVPIFRYELLTELRYDNLPSKVVSSLVVYDPNLKSHKLGNPDLPIKITKFTDYPELLVDRNIYHTHIYGTIPTSQSIYDSRLGDRTEVRVLNLPPAWMEVKVNGINDKFIIPAFTKTDPRMDLSLVTPSDTTPAYSYDEEILA